MFCFKQFSVQQDQCAMKIGTDAVLLGAWCPIDTNPRTILDIGAGTGILSLILAQRTSAHQIDAIEIEENAYEQCTDNFENSKWSDRLFCFHAGLDEFVEEPEDEYDLIISNPPFYTEDFKSDTKNRDLARFESSMPFEELVEAAALLLSDVGVFAVIIPFKEVEKFIALCESFDLFVIKVTHVKGSSKSKFIRSLLAFSRIDADFSMDELVIETSRHVYTEQYINLTKDFYLKM